MALDLARRMVADGFSDVPAAPPGAKDLPYDDGELMESERHVKQMTLLTESLGLAWKDGQDFHVGCNMFIYFSELQTRKNDFRGPDLWPRSSFRPTEAA